MTDRYTILHLQALQVLPIENDEQLRSLPEDIGNLSSSLTLDLFHSAIETLPRSIDTLVTLEELHLNGTTNLTSLPSEIGNLPNLIRLYLFGFNITALPRSIGGLQRLEFFDISDTKYLTSLPEEIGNLPNLVRPSLSGSNITALPRSIGGLQSLQSLNLADVKNLRTLPEESGNLPKLIAFNLKGSGIQSLSPSIEYNLACARFRSRAPRSGTNFTTTAWPIILENATHAFRSHEESKLGGLESHDVIYRLLVNYRESFVQMLISHNNPEKPATRPPQLLLQQ